MHQKYAMAFSSNITIVALKIADFLYQGFSSIFNIIIFHNIGALIIILYLHFVSLKEGTN